MRDAVRAGLLTLGYSEENIEADYIPVMALRNELDVGHVELGLLARDHLEVLHAYTERVEKPFRDLLKTLLDKVEANEFEVEPYQLGPPRSQVLQVIERLRQNTPQGAV